MNTEEKKQLYNHIGKNIRTAREKLKIKQIDFAKLLEISRASVVNIEKARQHPPLHLIFDIARVLKVKVTDLIPDSESLELKSTDKIISQKIRSYLTKWVKSNEPDDASNVIFKIEEFIQDNKS